MIRKQYLSAFFTVALAFLYSNTALAQVGVEDVGENIVDSVEGMPGLLAAIFYLLGLLFCATGVLKTKEHVDNPNQVPLRVPLIRFIAGGALFASPIVYEAIHDAFVNGSSSFYNTQTDIAGVVSGIFGSLSGIASFAGNMNAVFANILIFSDELPGLVAAVGYLLALLMGGLGILKIKDHVEDPDRTHLKEGVIRLLASGALFSLPLIFEAMYTTIAGSGMGVVGGILSFLSTWSFWYSSETQDLTGACSLLSYVSLGSSVGDAICQSWLNSAGLIAFLTGLAYLLGVVFGVWGVLKIRDHVLNPQQVSLSEGIMRLLAGGAFFALPFVVTVLQQTLVPVPLNVTGMGAANSGFNETASSLTCSLGISGLDQAMACFMIDVLGPSHVALNFFSFIAGMIFIMIGISRLIKSSQEGPKGPGGLGTVTTFVVGGILISATTLIRAVSQSMFGSALLLMPGQTRTYANLTYTTGMTPLETAAIYNVISAVLKFMIIVGLISFVRGLFIMRDVSEGKSQASVMSGMTHIIGGALAVNLGPLLNAVQYSLGVTGWGVTFG